MSEERCETCGGHDSDTIHDMAAEDNHRFVAPFVPCAVWRLCGRCGHDTVFHSLPDPRACFHHEEHACNCQGFVDGWPARSPKTPPPNAEPDEPNDHDHHASCRHCGVGLNVRCNWTDEIEGARTESAALAERVRVLGSYAAHWRSCRKWDSFGATPDTRIPCSCGLDIAIFGGKEAGK